jgi:hypothetical protein
MKHDVIVTSRQGVSSAIRYLGTQSAKRWQKEAQSLRPQRADASNGDLTGYISIAHNGFPAFNRLFYATSGLMQHSGKEGMHG